MKSLDCVHALSRTKVFGLNNNNIHHIRVDFLNSITSAQANFLKKRNVVPFMSLPNSLLHNCLEKYGSGGVTNVSTEVTCKEALFDFLPIINPVAFLVILFFL